VLVGPEGMHVNHPDAAIRQRTQDYLVALVDFCADLGGRILVFGSPKQRDVLPGVTPAQAREWALQTFRRATLQAEQRDVTICLEPLGPSETNFINSAVEAIELARDVGSQSFRIILDVKAMCSESKPILRIIRDSCPYFAHFHANDPNLKGPGSGKVDFQPIADVLNDLGYSGFVSVEVFNFDDGPAAIASGGLNYLRKVFGSA
jgi:sugar phosphate isomerase/epimerase